MNRSTWVYEILHKHVHGPSEGVQDFDGDRHQLQIQDRVFGFFTTACR